MKLMTKLMVIAALLLASVAFSAAKAATATATVTTASTNSLITVGARIQSYVVANSSAATCTIKFFDAPSTSLTYTNPAYTNYVSYTTNIVTSYVTYSGVTNSLTNSGLYSYSSTVAAATNNYRTIVTLTVPAGETVTYTPTDGTLVSFGLTSTNSTNAAITITYSPAL